MSTPRGYSSQEKEDRLSAQFSTVEPVREHQFGLSVNAHQFVYSVGSDAADAGSTAQVIIAAAHAAKKGDVLKFSGGSLGLIEVKVWEVGTNTIKLAETLPSAPTVGEGFEILRHKYPLVTSAGTLPITIVEDAIENAGSVPTTTEVKMAGGFDGTNARYLKTDSSGELQVDVLSSALPAGAATSTIQTDGTQKTQIVDGSGNVIGSTGNALDVNLKTPITVDVQLSQANDSVAVFGSDGAVNRALKTDANGELQVDVKLIEGVIDANNTTTVALPAAGNFTGVWTEIKDYNSINLGVFSDVPSATDGLRIEYSFDGISVHHFHLWTFPGGSNGVGYQLAAEFRYFRINYTNGASPQSSFLLQSNLKPTSLFPSSYRASQTFSSQSQVILTKGVIVGETTAGGGAYVAVKVNPSGALTTESTLAGLDAAVLGQDTMANSLPVVIASNQTAIPVTDNGSSLTVDGTVAVSSISNALPAGNNNIGDVDIASALPAGTNTIGKVDVNTLSPVDFARLDYTLTSVTTGAYVQLKASLAAAVKEVEIFDSSGQTLFFAVGAAASEVDKFYIIPGGNGRFPITIPAGSRVALKAVSATANTGEIDVNFLG